MRALLPFALLSLSALAACDNGTIGGDDTAAGDDTAIGDTATGDTATGDTATNDTSPPCTTVDAIVTDIDATLTTSDTEWLQRIIDSGHDEAMRPDADTLMQGYADKGYAIFYITARGADLPIAGEATATEATEDWLTRHGFPFQADHVYLASGIGALGGSAETYKADLITGLQAEGYVFHWGYGNADTDIAAYRDASIPDEDLFLVGDLAGQMGVTGISNDDAYTAHLPFLAQVPDAACPE